MKKYIRSFMALLLAALTVLSLTACRAEVPQAAEEPPVTQEPSGTTISAAELWAKVDETMDALDAYEMTADMQVVYYYMGYEITLDGTVSGVYTADAVYNESTAVVTCDELSMNQTISSVEAYYDGKMYIANNDGTYVQKFCSPMTFEEYEASQSDELGEDIDIEDCTSARCAQNADGTWSLEFTGYTKKTIDQVLQSMNLTEDILGVSIEDMKVSLTADADFRVKEMSVVFIFPASDDADALTPEFSVTTAFTKYNEAQFDPAKLKTEEFTEVPDVRLLSDLSEALKARQDATSGNFTLDISTTYVVQGQSSATVEKDTVTYGRKNGAYYYDIAAELAGEVFTIRYQNGVQTVIVDGETQTANQSEEEAKAFVDRLIDSAGYVPGTVTGIEQVEAGVYLLKVAAYDTSSFDATFQSMGMELISATQEMTVTMSEETLTGIHSTVIFTGTVSGETMTITLESTVSFEVTDSSISV